MRITQAVILGFVAALVLVTSVDAQLPIVGNSGGSGTKPPASGSTEEKTPSPGAKPPTDQGGTTPPTTGGNTNDKKEGDKTEGDKTEGGKTGVTLPPPAIGGDINVGGSNNNNNKNTGGGTQVVTSIAPTKTIVDKSSLRSSENDMSQNVDGGQESETAGAASKSTKSPSSNALSPYAIAGICACGFVALCAGLAAYSRWTRKGRNRRFDELQFGNEDQYGSSQHPFAHRANADPFKKDLGAHHHGGFP